MTRTKTHFCLDVKGFLFHKRKKREYSIFQHDDGKPMTVDEAKRYLLNELSKGHDYLPIGECDNFDYKKGCLSHPIPEDET